MWSIFSASSHQRRALILQGILTMCCFSQLSLLSGELTNATRVDPFTLFPREVSLKVLGYTDALTLGRAAQVSRRWRDLADDDLLWRSMCAQHIERKCEKCGWGLPLLSDKKRRRPPYVAQPPATTPTTTAAGAQPSPSSTHASLPQPETIAPTHPAVSHTHLSTPLNAHSSPNVSAAPSSDGPGGLKRSITAAANAAALEKRLRPSHGDHALDDTTAQESCRATKRARQDLDTTKPVATSAVGVSSVQLASSSQSSDVPGCGNIPVPGPNGLAPAPVLTRPWKSVYCERLVIERNWRRGRYGVKELRGHTDGIMCLKFSETLNHFPSSVVITGSYDRTARVWDLETGRELRVLRGHTRGVRCLQFDDIKLITGSMDRTLKIWNWRTGALYRTLEGHTAGIVCLHFNDDMLASGSADSEIKVWNFRSGECFTLRGHQDWINAVQLWTPPKPSSSPPEAAEGEELERPAFLFSASDDTTIKLWDLRTRHCLMTYEGHVTQVQSIRLTMMDPNTLLRLGQRHLPTTSRIKAGATSGTDPPGARGRPEGSVRGDYDDGTRCGYNPSNVPGGREANTSQPDLPPRFFSQAALPPAGQSTRLRSATPSPVRARNAPHHFEPLNPLRADDAPQLAWPDGGEEDDLLRSLSITPRRRSKLPKHLDRLHRVLSEAGLAPGLPADGELPDFYYALFDQEADSDMGTASKFQSAAPAEASEEPGCAAQRPVLISGSLDNTLKVFDVLTGVCVRTIFGHVEGVWAVDADNLRIVSASHDRTVKVWDRDTGVCESTLVGHTAPVTAVALGDDKIVSGSDDRTVRIWSFSPPPMAGAGATE